MTSKIVFYGDSQPWGLDGLAFYQSGGQPRVQVTIPDCVKVPGYTVENKAVCGSDSSSMLGTWATEMAKTDIAVVVMNWCLNDCVTLDYATYVSNMRSLRNAAVNAGKSVVFLTPHYSAASSVVAKLPTNVANMRVFASEAGQHLIDLYAYSQQYASCTPDGMHQNQYGHIEDGLFVNAALNKIFG